MSNIWNENDIKIIQDEYPFGNTRILADSLGRTTQEIRKKACELKIRKNRYMMWSEADIENLKKYYPTSPKEDIIKSLTPHPWKNIKKKSLSMGIYRRTSNMDKIKADTSILLDKNNQSAYWIGFLLADGHFSDRNVLSLFISQSDKKHVVKFSEFVKYTGKIKKYKNNAGFAVMDNHFVDAIKNKFDIHSNKTETPPDIRVFQSMTDEYFISMLIGFIDGDGHVAVRKNKRFSSISIKCHSSWMRNLSYFGERINKILRTNCPTGRIENSGYAKIMWSNQIVAKYLLRQSQHLNLPTLGRKWEKLKNSLNGLDWSSSRWGSVSQDTGLTDTVGLDLEIRKGFFTHYQ